MVEHFRGAFAQELSSSTLTLVHDTALVPLRVRPDILLKPSLGSMSDRRASIIEVNEHRHAHGPGFHGTMAPNRYAKQLSFAKLQASCDVLLRAGSTHGMEAPARIFPPLYCFS